MLRLKHMDYHDCTTENSMLILTDAAISLNWGRITPMVERSYSKLIFLPALYKSLKGICICSLNIKDSFGSCILNDKRFSRYTTPLLGTRTGAKA